MVYRRAILHKKFREQIWGKEEEKEEGSLWVLSQASREGFLCVAGAEKGLEHPGEPKAMCVDSGTGQATATELSQDTKSSVFPTGGAQLSSAEATAGTEEWGFVIRTREVLSVWGL